MGEAGDAQGGQGAGYEGLARERDESLVAAHAPGLAAGEDESGDAIDRSRLAAVLSRPLAADEIKKQILRLRSASLRRWGAAVPRRLGYSYAPASSKKRTSD